MVINFTYNALGEICEHPGKEKENNGSLKLPDDMGEGYLRQLFIRHLPALLICKFTPNNTVKLKEQMSHTNLCTLSFCLGDGIVWSLAETGNASFSIDRNESCIITGGAEQCISVYESGQYYHGVGVIFNPYRIQDVAECLRCENALSSSGSIAKGLKRYVVTPRVSGILSQMMDCDVSGGSLKDIYLEGKLLELIAVYLDEMVCQRGGDNIRTPLSKEDLSALTQAKEILDKTFVHPLTLSELSRKVYLNEYKLKTGFKLRYGQTVYSYIVDKRMELARVLIEQRRFKVGDVAGLVGYTNTGHFIKTFSKKYGITPGEFITRRKDVHPLI